MMNRLLSKILESGGLYQVLDLEFKKLSTNIRVQRTDNTQLVILEEKYANVEFNNNNTEIQLIPELDCLEVNYWRNGVWMAYGQTKNIKELTTSIVDWLELKPITLDFTIEFNFVKSTEQAKYFDEDNETMYAWKKILNDSNFEQLKDFISIAIKDDILCYLFPFTSLNVLCLSRCTGYPYTSDTPIIISLDNDFYEVRTSENIIIGNGNSNEAINLVKSNLPFGIKPAIKGTAEEVEQT